MDLEAFRVRYVAIHWLLRYPRPAVVLVGTLANMATVLVMSRERTRRLSISPYLVVLAISDTTVLWAGQFRHWLKYVSGTDMRTTSLAACKLLPWTLMTCSHYSAWLLVLLTLERFLCVSSPIAARSRPREISVPVKLTGLLAVFMALNGHFLYSYQLVAAAAPRTNSSRLSCLKRAGHGYQVFVSRYWPWIDLIVYCFMPFAILVTCNTVIVYRLKNSGNLTEGQTERNRVSRKTVNVALVIALNLAFLICSLPVSIYQLTYKSLLIPGDLLNRMDVDLFQLTSSLLMYTGNAVNFFLYLISGRIIRKEFLSMFRRKTGDRRQTSSVVSIT